MVVVAIIGVLAALLLPAIQSAREAGRRSTCSNNLKQIGLAFQNHHDAHGFFPTSGWGYAWIGDPDRGYRLSQMGGWSYNILSYIDQDSLRQIGKDQSAADKPALLTTLTVQPVALYICPTRRRARAYPASEGGVNYVLGPVNSKTDYAGNAGDNVTTFYGPTTTAQGDSPNYQWPVLTSETGITYGRSMVSTASIPDGASHTFAVGEKFLRPALYLTGTDGDDNDSAYVGHDWDNLRWGSATYMPLNDTDNMQNVQNDGWPYFGSAHSSGVFFVFCDGSVHLLNYSINPQVYDNLANRQDRSRIDETQY